MSVYPYQGHGHDWTRLRSSSVNNVLSDPSRATLRAHPAISVMAALLLLIVALNVSLLLFAVL